MPIVENQVSYLVTGGAGFIGSALVHHLVAHGQRVRVLDNLSTGHMQNLAAVSDRIEFIHGDICDLDVCKVAARGVDYVLHQAALPSVPRSIEQPWLTHQANANGTLNLLIAAREAGCKRFVYASSSSVYGNSDVLPKVETMPTAPLSPYAVSKLAGEQYVLVFHYVYGLETVALRYFNVFGPRQNGDSPYSGVLSRFITAALHRQVPIVFGDGEQSRDFTFVEDVVQANLSACTARHAPGKVFNVGTGRRHTLLEAVSVLGEIVGADLRPFHAPPRRGDVRHSQAEIKRAQEVLSYSPSVSFSEGMARTVEWWREFSKPALRAPTQ